MPPSTPFAALSALQLNVHERSRGRPNPVARLEAAVCTSFRFACMQCQTGRGLMTTAKSRRSSSWTWSSARRRHESPEPPSRGRPPTAAPDHPSHAEHQIPDANARHAECAGSARMRAGRRTPIVTMVPHEMRTICRISRAGGCSVSLPAVSVLVPGPAPGAARVAMAPFPCVPADAATDSHPVC